MRPAVRPYKGGGGLGGKVVQGRDVRDAFCRDAVGRQGVGESDALGADGAERGDADDAVLVLGQELAREADALLAEDERVARGKAARKAVPRESHAGFEAPADRADPGRRERSEGVL